MKRGRQQLSGRRETPFPKPVRGRMTRGRQQQKIRSARGRQQQIQWAWRAFDPASRRSYLAKALHEKASLVASYSQNSSHLDKWEHMKVV
jgi:hypothetical protein